MRTDMKKQIKRVQAVQDLNDIDAADQVRCRVHDARQYLKKRATR